MRAMKRILVFTLLFPPLALVVFAAPEAISHRAIPSWDSIPLAYLVALIPAWLSAAVDRALSATSSNREDNGILS